MQYKNLFIYKIDTRVKILFILIFTILSFVVDKFPVCVILLISILTIRIAWKIPFRSVKTIITISLLVILTHTLFAEGENYIFKPIFGFSLKRDGLFSGLTIACRLSALLLLFPILTETASSHKIARAFVCFCTNYRIAFIISSAFNMIPLFREEGRTIMDAQKLRGSDVFEERIRVYRKPAQNCTFGTHANKRKIMDRKFLGFVIKLKAYPSLVVPLVLGAMRKAQSASVAMDSRAFGAFKTRTWLEKSVMKVHDYLFLAGFLLFSCIVLFANCFLF
ncbi:MAG: energy-coupling factor transporter transmembrane protein EcfT [Treponema sp.]|jgi:energy-coupling factor transport system permease protein|nr:energy-coupling factor transporter transmembrane protein EcfT [Treponema sp.]